MKFALASLFLAAGAAAAPTEASSEVAPRALSDADILNFALTLEHLEDTFYSEALAKFGPQDFVKAGHDKRFRFNLGEVSSDESTHVKTLTAALKAAGAKPVPKCKYNFGLTDVPTFVKTASILEGVGITAYLGAAKDISNPEYLTEAGSILTVESRHNAYIRDHQRTSPFPQPFDTPLTPKQAFSLASAFIESCPFKLPYTPYPAMTLTSSTKQPIRAGMTATFDVAAKSLSGPLYGHWMTVTGPITMKATKMGKSQVQIEVPKGIAGQSYVVLGSNAKKVTDASTIAGPGIVMVQAPYTYGGIPKA